MKKLLLVAAIAAVLLPIDNAANAAAGNLRAGPNAKSRVTCPAGTCGPGGHTHPAALNMCSAANCRK